MLPQRIRPLTHAVVVHVSCPSGAAAPGLARCSSSITGVFDSLEKHQETEALSSHRTSVAERLVNEVRKREAFQVLAGQSTSWEGSGRLPRSAYGFSWALPQLHDMSSLEVKFPDPLELYETLRKNANGSFVSADAAESMVAEFRKLLRALPSPVIDLDVPQVEGAEDPRLVIVGDTHGQLLDVLHIFETHGLPSESVVYLFNGDIVDRGRHAVEIWLLIIAFKLKWPSSVHVLRGNHENEQMIVRPLKMGGGFSEECLDKYSRAVLAAFQRVFKLLPLFAVLEQEIFVVHGGLFRNKSVDLERLRQLPRTSWRRNYPNPLSQEQTARGEKWSEDEEILFDALWADPHYGSGSRQSSRGRVAVTFGEDVTQKFLDSAGLSLCLRSHRVPQSGRGFEFEHGGRLLTVFSASRYGGVLQNRGAVAVLRRADGESLQPGVDGPDSEPLAAVAARREARAAERQEQAGGSSGSSAGLAPEPRGRRTLPPLRRVRLSIIEHLVDSPKALAALVARGATSSANYGQDRLASEQVRRILAQETRGYKVSVLQQSLAMLCAERERLWRHCRESDVGYRGVLPRTLVQALLRDACGESAACLDALVESATISGDRVVYGELLAAPTVRWYHHGNTSLGQLAQATAQAELRLAGLASLFDSAKDGIITPAVASEAMTRLMPSAQDCQRAEVASFLFGKEQTSLSDVLHKLACLSELPELGESWMEAALRRLASLVEEAHGPGPLHAALLRFFRKHDKDGSELMTAEEFVQGFQSLAQASSSVAPSEVQLLHPGRLYKLFSAIDSNRTGTVSFLELLIAFDDRKGWTQPVMSEAPALEGELPAMLLVHKDAVFQICRALDRKDAGYISVEHFLEILECLTQVLARPLSGAARQRLERDLAHKEGLPYSKALEAASFEVSTRGGRGLALEAEALHRDDGDG